MITKTSFMLLKNQINIVIHEANGRIRLILSLPINKRYKESQKYCKFIHITIEVEQTFISKSLFE